MEVDPACVEIGLVPSLCSPLDFPSFNLPQRSAAANALIRFPAQLPAVELMAFECFPFAQKHAVGLGFQRSVADLQASFPCFKWQQTGHGMQPPFLIGQALPQHQHPSTFGINGLVANPFMQ